MALVNTPEEGVPNAGVTRVGLVDKTTEPLPVTPLDKSVAESCATETEPPTVTCFSTREVPPVADKLEPVPPFATPSVPDIVIVPLFVIGPPV